MRTVAILGGAYAGASAAATLAAGLPEGWRIVVIDRNSHLNHVYVMPRYSVLGGHEHKAFCPMNNIFNLPPSSSQISQSSSHDQLGISRVPPAYHQLNHPHLILNAEVVALTPTHIILSKSFPEYGEGFTSNQVGYDFLIYALGSKLPPPLDLWGTFPGGIPLDTRASSGEAINDDPKRGSIKTTIYRGAKNEGIAWLKAHQMLIEDAQSILVVGGGALGIQFATDIADIYSHKSVTLLHSREKLLPRFNAEMHTEIYLALESLGVHVILNERLADKDAPPKFNEKGQRVVNTTKGREIVADLVLMCTGQAPNTSILKAMNPLTVNPHDGLAHVLKTMQLTVLQIELSSDIDTNNSASETGNRMKTPSQQEPTPYPHIFVVGDAADAFGAIAAGHTADFQAKVAARNILRLVQIREQEKQKCGDREDEELEEYVPTEPGIKVSLGLRNSIYQINGVVGKRSNGTDDMDAAYLWKYWGTKVDSERDMYL
ncbi:FAD/NAD(P)-binding domain-containing protein [Dendrothele bispora CBS 962.96]|uniref:FAD/NAD(P)-binding domain-containing protein n=1 Tax=Dendrothele bispora (strain CBS 962.96) TaxID=1314807 RepID=A0A4S8M521_DENBC|nr:FAD/NAD(P)-binding domain-containing protein [Dendrothele bispora CBS 962.96]